MYSAVSMDTILFADAKLVYPLEAHMQSLCCSHIEGRKEGIGSHRFDPL